MITKQDVARIVSEAASKNHLHIRNVQLKANYGITLDQYNEICLAQKGLCAICYSLCSSGRRLAVDHNHNSI